MAARRFVEGADEGLTEDELRLEAAFRCWLQGLDTHDRPPHQLPSWTMLSGLADQWDVEYGAHVWWSWPVWNSCSSCATGQAPTCSQCISYIRYCWLSRGWCAGEECRGGARRAAASR